MKNVLVTGASGFMGKSLCERLQTEGVVVNALLRHSTTGPWSQVIEQDLTLPLPIEKLKNSLQGIDTIFHLAAVTHTGNTAIPREHYWAINVTTTKALLQLAVELGASHFVYMSSVKAINPTDNYGHSKKAAEDFILSFGKNNGLSVSILQPALVYGPSVKGNLFSMLRLIQKGLFLPPPEVHNARSMIGLADVITAMLLVVENPIANGKIYTLTDEHHYSTKEIYDAMRSALGLSPMRWSFPFIFFKIMAHVGDCAERLFKHRLPFNSEVLEKFFGSAVYSSKRIREELGFESHYTLFSNLPEIVKSIN